jgi:hypothetical protein
MVPASRYPTTMQPTKAMMEVAKFKQNRVKNGINGKNTGTKVVKQLLKKLT